MELHVTQIFKGCLPQISLGPFLNTLYHVRSLSISKYWLLVTTTHAQGLCLLVNIGCWLLLIMPNVVSIKTYSVVMHNYSNDIKTCQKYILTTVSHAKNNDKVFHWNIFAETCKSLLDTLHIKTREFCYREHIPFLSPM